MSEQEKKNNKESMIFLKPRPTQSFFVCCIQSKEKFSTEKKKKIKQKGEWRIEQKMKRRLFNCSRIAIKKDLTMSIRKYANELNVHEKTVRRAIKI